MRLNASVIRAGVASDSVGVARVQAAAILRLVLAGSLGAGLSACEPASTDPCDTDPTGCLESYDFKADTDCSESEMNGELEVRWGPRDAVWGPQGGMHMEVGAWVGNLNPGRERALVTFQLSYHYTDEETGELLEAVYDTRSVEIGTGVWTAQDDGMSVDGLVWFTDAEGLYDPPEWRVEVTDACGRTGFHQEG